MKTKFNIGDKVLCKFNDGIFLCKIIDLYSPDSSCVICEVRDMVTNEGRYFINEEKVIKATKEEIRNSCDELYTRLVKLYLTRKSCA